MSVFGRPPTRRVGLEFHRAAQGFKAVDHRFRPAANSSPTKLAAATSDHNAASSAMVFLTLGIIDPPYVDATLAWLLLGLPQSPPGECSACGVRVRPQSLPAATLDRQLSQTGISVRRRNPEKGCLNQVDYPGSRGAGALRGGHRAPVWRGARSYRDAAVGQ